MLQGSGRCNGHRQRQDAAAWNNPRASPPPLSLALILLLNTAILGAGRNDHVTHGAGQPHWGHSDVTQLSGTLQNRNDSVHSVSVSDLLLA